MENFYQPYAMQRVSSVVDKVEDSQLYPSEEIIKSSVEVIYEFE
jgi:hypothetical protein